MCMYKYVRNHWFFKIRLYNTNLFKSRTVVPIRKLVKIY